MQRFQKSFNAFIERFQDRWETQPAFRATWGTLGAASFLLILCVCALTGSNLLGGLFTGFGNVTSGSVVIDANNKTSSFPINQLTPQGTSVTGVIPTPVATTTYSPSPTPTVTPAGPTPTMTPSVTDTPTSPTFTVTASQSAVWKAGLPGFIQNITTSPTISNVTMMITLQFGPASENCTVGPISVPLDKNGAYPGQKSFPVPSCFVENNVTVSALYHIDGYTDYPFPDEFAAQK